MRLPSPSSESTPGETPRSVSSSVAASDPCELLTTSEVERLTGESVGEPKPGLTGGVPNCQWAVPDGRYVQTVGVEAAEWARSLPELIRIIEASGEFSDTENMRKLRQGADLVEAGQDLDPGAACSLFSQMVELQGQPPGNSWIVTVVPTRTDAQAVTGQMCSVGSFTSVMVADMEGLDGPLPLDEVAEAIKLAHR